MIFVTNQKWPSTRIRGYQIAKRLGAKCDPDKLIVDEMTIFVKTFDEQLIAQLKNVYLDINDSDVALPLVSVLPHTKVIAISKLAKDYISSRVRNKVVIIPEQHCNFENIRRDLARPKKVVGYVGSKFCFDLDTDELTKMLHEKGLEFQVLFCDDIYVTRKEVCDFYKTIDIQVCFRLPRLVANMPPELKNDLKIKNAASFGIPTVAYPELSYRKLAAGVFIPAMSLQEVVEKCHQLKVGADMYAYYVKMGYEYSEQSHIDRIAHLYEELE